MFVANGGVRSMPPRMESQSRLLPWDLREYPPYPDFPGHPRPGISARLYGAHKEPARHTLSIHRSTVFPTFNCGF